MTTPIPGPHSALLDRIVAALRRDDRLEAVLVSGSLVNGGFDDHSDLDLVVLVRPDVYVATMSERRAIAESIGGLLAAFTGEHVGEPRLLICLYGPPLVHVDLKFVTPEDMRSLVERPRLLWAREPSKVQECIEVADVAWPNRSPQWFEDRAWVWLHYCAAKLLRGELYEAIGMLAFFREQILGPMFHRGWKRGPGCTTPSSCNIAGYVACCAATMRTTGFRATTTRWHHSITKSDASGSHALPRKPAEYDVD